MNNTKVIKPDFFQINSWLNQAKKDLVTARKNLTIDAQWSLAIAYQAMLKMGRALMFSFGHLPHGPAQHKTVVEFTAKKLGLEYQNLANQFERLRRKRHDFFYSRLAGTSLTEAKTAVKSGQNLLTQVQSIISARDPQKKLL